MSGSGSISFSCYEFRLNSRCPSTMHQVGMLNTRLATAESMTHDVIRDLLSVKLDISNYAVSPGLHTKYRSRFSV